jgi:hypothetical protein
MIPARLQLVFPPAATSRAPCKELIDCSPLRLELSHLHRITDAYILQNTRSLGRGPHLNRFHTPPFS